MIQIWFARVSLKAAIRADHLEIEGPKDAPTHLRSWFLLSPINMASLSNRVEVSPQHPHARAG
jgi:hypothetical protein